MKLLLLLLGLARAEYCSKDVCHFELVLKYRFTMSCLNDNPEHPYWYPVEIDENGKPVHQYNSAFYPANETLREHGTEEVPPFPGGMWFFDEHEFDDTKCIYGDGGKQGIVTINDQHPGPVLEVVEGALVHVTIVNELLGGAAFSMHFHGFKFDKGYFWYDGVAMIQQCPITSGQSFTYSFIASEVGLRWYHGHGSGLKLDGLYGPIIVHKKRVPRNVEPNVLMINDHISATGGAGAVIQSSVWGETYGSGELNNNMNTRWFLEDGTFTTSSTIDSLLIDGRMATFDNKIPMRTYDMRINKFIHLVCSSTEFGVEIEVANHEIRLWEMDGYPVNTVTRRRLYLGPAETAKISLVSLDDNDTSMKNVLLKANAAGSYKGWKDKEKKKKTQSPMSYAILKLAENDDLDMDNQKFSEFNDIMNQPYFRDDMKWVTINTDKRLLGKQDYYPSPKDEVYKVHLNINFANGPVIQGRKFKKATVPFSTRGELDDYNVCKNCNTKRCECTHMHKIPLNSIVEMTLTSYSDREIGHFYHPMHLHGHEMYVMAHGSGQYNQTSGLMVPGGQNENFECVDISTGGRTIMNCPFTRPTGVNNITMNYKNPPKRTTVHVPNNGFVVVRFKANNPGLWFFHCHVFSHMLKGMAMIFDISDQGVPPVPPNMPTCPIQEAEVADPDRLVSLKSIGAPEPKNGAQLIVLALFTRLINLL